MSALVWQALIAGSIVSAFVLGRALLPLRRAIQLGTATAGFWMLWTLGLSSWFVGYAISGGLQNFQFALIVAVTLMALGAVLIYGHNAQQREVLEKNNAVLRGGITKLQEAFEGLTISGEIKPTRVVQGSMAHREELIRQLRRSRRSLIILSGWVSEYAFDTELKREFQRALRRGVEIRIGWGCQTNKEAACDIWKPNEAETWLRELERKFKGRLMTHRFRNHAKLLVCDDEAILGSHNWLSNVSSPNEELSLATNDPQVIEELLSKVAPRFKQSRGDRRPGIWFVSKRLRDVPEGGIKA